MRDLATLRSDAVLEADLPLRVLIAEDDPTQRLLLAATLEAAGYLVDVSTNGSDALEQLQSGAHAILVTDWEMPGLDGPTLCKEIRCSNLPHYVYILMLTSHEHTSDLIEGLDSGADDFVRKSSASAELRARLAAGARLVRLERSLRAAQSRIEILSVTDPLVDLFNRRYLASTLDEQIARCRRYGHAVSVILMDLDHFKRINDLHGHLVGDEILVAVASFVRSQLRRTDWAARYGGEEFVIVLTETDSRGARTVAEKLRRTLAADPLTTTGGPLSVTASFGVATLAPQPHESAPPAEHLLGRADRALYRSKAAGRNCVTCID